MSQENSPLSGLKLSPKMQEKWKSCKERIPDATDQVLLERMITLFTYMLDQSSDGWKICKMREEEASLIDLSDLLWFS